MPIPRLKDATHVTFAMKSGETKRFEITNPVKVAINVQIRLRDNDTFSMINKAGMLEIFRAEDVKEVEFL